MIHPIVRLYRSAQDAHAAAAKLKAWGISDDLISVHTAAADHAGQSHEALTAAIASRYVLKAKASQFAKAMQRGLSVVVVNAPFGLGATVSYVLDSVGPVDGGIPAEHDGLYWDEAAPFSSAFRLPVLTKHPFFFGGIPMVTRQGRPMFVGALSSAPTTGGMMPLLSANAAPFSSLLKLPLLR